MPVRQTLGALFGSSRSGTTWLGAAFATHPDVAYRFEPFHRSKAESPLRELDQRIWDGDDAVSEAEIVDAIAPAIPATCKPPFFRKSFLNSPSWWRGVLWALSRKSGVTAPLFVWLNDSRNAKHIVFKEVEKIHILEWLLKHTHVPITYLLRDPRAVVASRLRGQTKRLMPTKRRKYLPSILARNSELHERFAARVHELSDAAAEALLWRLDVERAYNAIKRFRDVQTVYYEDLVRDPVDQIRRVFDHQQLTFPDSTRAFIDMSRTTPSPFRRFLHGELPIHKYFTVFRAMNGENGWIDELSSEQLREIDAIVQDSEIVQSAQHAEKWLKPSQIRQTHASISLKHSCLASSTPDGQGSVSQQGVERHMDQG